MKGIILAGGRGTRLYPLTQVVSKQLLPVYDKPVIYYPLTTLMLTEIREFLIISTPEDLPAIRSLLGDGSPLGIQITYAEQPVPGGIAQSLLIGASFTRNESVALILGDNLFFGDSLVEQLKRAMQLESGAVIFTRKVADPKAYGLAELSSGGKVLSLIEKPQNPISDLAVTSLYLFDARACSLASQLLPSLRGELEILDLLEIYRQEDSLTAEILGKDTSWFDVGTVQNLHEASRYVAEKQNASGQLLGSIEGTACRLGLISESQLQQLALPLAQSQYGQLLLETIEDKATLP